MGNQFVDLSVGDLFAWLYYMKFSDFMVFIGVVVLLLNLLYLAFV